RDTDRRSRRRDGAGRNGETGEGYAGSGSERTKAGELKLAGPDAQRLEGKHGVVAGMVYCGARMLRAWQNRRGIEARLALGANRWEAMRPISPAAMANAHIPSTDAMSASGIVYLPGMMTG
ncbi:MAG: ABC transporter permease, partial [Pseudomonadota bacterium]|nr:ABC transporter permease [Pseudomonadota bacterium]